MDCFCDYDPAVVYYRDQRRARNTYRCDECGKSIQKTEQYEHVFGLWDGNWDKFRTCCRCLAVKAYVLAHVPCFCWAHGHILEDADETINHYRHETPGLYFGYARLRVVIERAKI